MELRLVAGPFNDAAAAAKICAVMVENKRTCETTIFDGQRLALAGDETPAVVKPAAKPAPHRRSSKAPGGSRGTDQTGAVGAVGLFQQASAINYIIAMRCDEF